MKRCLFILAIFLLSIFSSRFSYAASCITPSGGGSLQESCTFSGSVDGVDAGSGTTNTATLNIPNNTTLTIGNIAQTVAFGIVKVLPVNQSITGFATTGQSQLPTSLGYNTNVTATIGSSTYVYVLGGRHAGTTQSTVYKATIDTSGNIGAFATTSQGQLPTINGPNGTENVTAITGVTSGTTYIYMIGGTNNGALSTVYKAQIDTSGNIGAWATTSQAQLPVVMTYPTSITLTYGGTQYIYLFGGAGSSGATIYSTVYRAQISSGNVGAWATTSQSQLPVTSVAHNVSSATVGGTNYLYLIGGDTNFTTFRSTVYKAMVDTSGNVGAWATTSQGQLPALLDSNTSSVVTVGGTNYLYLFGGWDNTLSTDVSTVYRAQIDSSGNLGAFATTNQTQLPEERDWALSGNSKIGPLTYGGTQYIYFIGGGDTVNVSRSDVYRASIGNTKGKIIFNKGQGASLKKAGIWMTDSDGDGYPASTTQVISTTNPGSSTRRNAMVSTSSLDCNDSSANVYQNVSNLVLDSDNDGFPTSTTGSSQCVGDTSVVNTRTYYKASGGGYDYIDSGSILAAAGGGDIGTFSTTGQAQLPAAEQFNGGASVTIGGTNYLYMVGGCNTACWTDSVATVYKGTVGANGDVTSWTTGTALPAARGANTVIAATIGGTSYLYSLAGVDTGQASRSLIYKSTLSAGGANSAWTTETHFLDYSTWNGDNYASGLTTTYNNTTYLFVFGGSCCSAANSTIFRVALTATGAFATSFTTSSMANLRYNLSVDSLIIGGTTYIYALAGHDTASNFSTVFKWPLGAAGAPGTLAAQNSLTPHQGPCNKEFSATIGGTNYILYADGGQNLQATVDSAGTLSAWTSTGQGTSNGIHCYALSGQSVVGGTNYAYIYGGNSAVYKAMITSATQVDCNDSNGAVYPGVGC